MPLPPLPPRAVHKEIRKVDATTSGNGANNRPGADDGYGADAEASLGPGEFSSDGSDLHLSDSSDGSDIDPNEMPSEYRSTSQDIKEDEMPGEFKLTAKTIQKGKLSRESESTGQNVKDEPSAEWSDSAASNEAALAPDGYGADEELSLRGEADASKKAGDRAAPAERPEAGNAQEIGPVQLPLPMGLWMNVAHIILEFDPQGSASRDGTLQVLLPPSRPSLLPLQHNVPHCTAPLRARCAAWRRAGVRGRHHAGRQHFDLQCVGSEQG